MIKMDWLLSVVVALLLLLLFVATETLQTGNVRVVHWSRGNNYADASNWSRQRTPCGGDEVLFAEDASSFVLLDQAIALQQMTLSDHVTISLANNAAITALQQREEACPAEDLEYTRKRGSDPNNWHFYSSPFTPLPYEMAPCNGDQLMFDSVVDLMVLNNLTALSLHSIAITRPEARVINDTSSLEALKREVQNDYDLFLKTDHISFRPPAPFCDCLFENMHKYPNLCNSVACPATPFCSSSFTPYGSCCPSCALTYDFLLGRACDTFEKFFNRLSQHITSHPKFESFRKQGNVSISYVGNLRTQVTLAGLTDQHLNDALEIMNGLSRESACYRVEKTSNYLHPSHSSPPPSSPGSGSGLVFSVLSLLLIFSFLTFCYVKRHSIRSRYIPHVVEVVRGWRGGGGSSMEMRGGVIFDNSSIFDASVSSLRDQQSFGSGRERLVEEDFSQTSPPQREARTPTRRKQDKEIAFSNPKFQEGKTKSKTKEKETDKNEETLNKNKKTKYGKEGMKKKKEVREEEEEEGGGGDNEGSGRDEKVGSESFENAFFKI